MPQQSPFLRSTCLKVFLSQEAPEVLNRKWLNAETRRQGRPSTQSGRREGPLRVFCAESIATSGSLSGAKALGAIKIGDNSRVAANSVVLREVPENATVVGVPGRVVKISGEKLDHIHTPDPVMLEIEQLRLQVMELEAKLDAIKE